MKNELWKWRNGGKRGNPKAGFPLFPPFLGNLANNARFPHFHSSGGSRRMEKWKTKSRFPTFPLAVFSSPKTNQKGGLAADRFAPAFRLILGLENALTA